MTLDELLGESYTFGHHHYVRERNLRKRITEYVLGIIGEDEAESALSPNRSIEMSMMHDARNQLRAEQRKRLEM